ncbi:hypothetical protein K2X30_11135 [bacterium]|jgi:N-acetylneuraminic acid mutarotase|nr:hypothetical protein [bacterium]
MGTVTISVAAGTASDAVGNTAIAAGPSASVSINPVVTGPMLVQRRSVDITTSVSSLPLAFSSNNTAGNLIVVACQYRNAAAQTATASVSDSRGNTYAPVGNQARANVGRGYLFYAANVAAGANTVTCTFSSAQDSMMYIAEYNGVATTSPLVGSNTGSGSSATPNISVTTTAANDLVIGLLDNSNYLTATVWPGANFMMDKFNLLHPSVMSAVFGTAGAQSVNSFLGLSSSWYMVAGAFKASLGTSTASAVYNFGGISGGSIFSTVIKSLDARNWTVVGHLPAARAAGCSLSYGGALWYIGGSNGSASVDTVYKSTDGGITWTNPGNLPGLRDGLACVVFNNAMWAIGGATNMGSLNGTGSQARTTVYSSTDGITWTLIGNIPAALLSHSATVFNGKMWIAGGMDIGDAIQTSVYWSSDGITWSTVGAAPLPAARYNAGMATFANKMWFVSGQDNGGAPTDTVWSCGDPCASWTVNTALPFIAYSHSAVPFNGKLMSLWGQNVNLNENYSTDDGTSWTTLTNFLAYTSRMLAPTVAALGN